MATSEEPNKAANGWDDSDIEISSEDDDPSKNTKTEMKESAEKPLNDQSNEDDEPQHDDPSHLKLSFFDHYQESRAYSHIRKRKIQRKHKNNDHEEDQKSTKNEEAQQRKVTINDLRSHRILYEIHNYERKWSWIDSLPTDDMSDHLWITQYSNLNLFPHQLENVNKESEDKPRNTEDEEGKYVDIDEWALSNDSIERQTVGDFDFNLNEFRKSVINSPLFPKLGCCGYCKEFYVTLCDWSNEGVMAIKYISEEAQRSVAESKATGSHRGYWQRVRYQISASQNGQYIALLFDRYCIVRGYKDNFSANLFKIKLSPSFWDFTQLRFVQWSDGGELFAISSYHSDILIYDNKGHQILAIVPNRNDTDSIITGLVWRKFHKHSQQQSGDYWLELIALFENGQLHRRALQINAATKQVIDLDKVSQVSNIQFPHRNISKWIYDGIDYCPNTKQMAVSCVPSKLLDTKPRKSRLGHALMLMRFDGNSDIVVTKHYNSVIPSNSWFKVDSVCFTMMDRRCKFRGRDVSISPDGKHILCVDLRANVEIFEIPSDDSDKLELIAKIGNVREMSYGSFRPDARIYTASWWNNGSIMVAFCDNTFCITPIESIRYYNQREMKWSLNYLGQERERLYGIPIISKTVPIANNDKEEKDDNGDDLNMFFILEVNDGYLRRMDDKLLKYYEQPSNDIEKRQNDVYGFRRYRSISLSTFSSITSMQLFEKYLKNHEFDQALKIAGIFKLNSDPAYQAKFNHLVNKYNLNASSSANQSQQQQQQQSSQSNDNKVCSEWIEILSQIDDESWIIDTLLSISVSSFYILDRLLLHGMRMMEHSQKMRDLRPKAFAKFLQFRERASTLKYIMSEMKNFNVPLILNQESAKDEKEPLIFSNYLAFRQLNMSEFGYRLAAQNKLFALIALFKYHFYEIPKTERLSILSWIPDTAHPNLYCDILPSVTKPTWTTDRWFAKEFGLSTSDKEDDEDDVDCKQIEAWYKEKIYGIEENCGNVENSLILCNYAVSMKGIKSLSPLLETLLLFHKIVYEYVSDESISMKQFEVMDAESRLLLVLKKSHYEDVISHIEDRSQYFVSERDLPLILLNICPKLSMIGKIDLVAAILKSHKQFDLLSVIKTYLSSSQSIFRKEQKTKNKDKEVSRNVRDDADDDWDDFDDNFSDEDIKENDTASEKSYVYKSVYDVMNENDLLIEYALLCGLKCDDVALFEKNAKIWNGFDELLSAVDSIKQDNTKSNYLDLLTKTNEIPQRISQFTALSKGGEQLAKSYNIHQSLKFYYVLLNVGNIGDDDSVFTETMMNECDIAENIREWNKVLNVSDHQLQNYEVLNTLLSDPNEKAAATDTKLICKELKCLAVDIVTDLFRGIQQKVSSDLLQFMFYFALYIHFFLKARKFEDNEDWKELRVNLLNFQYQLFSFIDTETIEYQFFTIVFDCCSFDYVRKMMKAESPLLSNEDWIKLTLKTANELINASVSYDSSELEQAEICLSLIEGKNRSSKVWQLLDLISAVKLLHKEFSFDVVPFELRKLFHDQSKSKYFAKEHLGFFDRILRCNASENYLKKEELLQFIEYLNMSNDEHKVQLLCVLAEYGLNQMEQHFSSSNKISIKAGLECQLFSYQIYQEIFEKKYMKKSKKYPNNIMSKLFFICSKLMESTTKCNENNIGTFQLLSHSLTTSSSDKIFDILRLWQSVNAKDNYYHIVHSIAMSIRKRRGDIISDSEDSDDYQNGDIATNSDVDKNDWADFVEDIEQRPPSYKTMNAEEIKKEVEMNEMEQMIDCYFDTDPDLLANHENDEIYSFLSSTNTNLNQLDLLSNALIPCSNINDFESYPNGQSFEILILNIIENMYLCDTTQLITFLMLVDDIDIMHKSFNAVLTNKNIARFKRTQIIEIAIKYFTYQTMNKVQQCLEYVEDEEVANAIYSIMPSNISSVLSMELCNEDSDYDEEEEDEEQMTIEKIVKCTELGQLNDEEVDKCRKKALSYYVKWRKIAK